MAHSSDTPAPGPEKRLTAADIARDWGCSRAYVSVCITKKGCPTDSLESARKWRQDNAKYGVGYRSKKNAQEVAAAVAGDSPPPSPLTSSPKPTPQSSPTGALGDVGESRDLSDIEASLRAAIEIEQEAHRLVLSAQKLQSDAVIAVRIQAYNKAQSNRLDAEKRVQEFLEKQGTLVTMDKARDAIRRAISPLLTRLRALPKRAAIKANPADDVHAESVLTAEVEEIIKEVRDEYVIP